MDLISRSPVYEKFNTDTIAIGIFRSMVQDFRTHHEHFHPRLDSINTVGEVREYLNEFSAFGTSPERFRAHAQVINLLKKWRFMDDVFTQEQLVELTIQKYMDEQARLTAYPPSRSFLTTEVLRCARKHARRILGRYNPDEHIRLSRLGKNASIGCPLHKAYVDVKLTRAETMTGSFSVGRWFKENFFDADPLLRETILSHRSREVRKSNYPFFKYLLRPTEVLNLSLVDKSWKTLRIITPLPLLDLFYSNGLGDMVVERLRVEGIDIARQQHRHRDMVREMSVTLRHVTADLSAASDSLTSPLLNAVLPREWFNVLRKIFFRSVSHDGRTFHTASVLPMGNGATFPIETLVFYCLLLGLSELAGVRGTVSVYGDDLIYPSRLHRYVARFFSELGLKLNLDKTYVRCNFRESCGSDFYHGFDVRPFFLEGKGQAVSPMQTTAFLYQCINGLRDKYEWCELPTTFGFLFRMLSIASFGRKLYRVPESFPDTSGVRVSSYDEIPLSLTLLDWSPVVCRFEHGTELVKLACLKTVPDKRHVVEQRAYLWLRLQDRDDTSRTWSELEKLEERRFWILTDPRHSTPEQLVGFGYSKKFVNGEAEVVRRYTVSSKAKGSLRFAKTVIRVIDWGRSRTVGQI